MTNYDIPVHKAVHFDLNVNDLSRYYSKTNPNRGYSIIRNFLMKNDYVHTQYSGYQSKYPTTDMKVFDLVRRMQDEMPWIERCARKFEVSNLNENHDVMKLLARKAKDPKVRKTTN